MKQREAKNSPALAVPASFKRKLVPYRAHVNIDWFSIPVEKLAAEAHKYIAERQLEDPNLPDDSHEYTLLWQFDYGDHDLMAEWMLPESDKEYAARYKRYLANKKAAETRRAKKEAKERAQYEKLKEKFGE